MKIISSFWIIFPEESPPTTGLPREPLRKVKEKVCQLPADKTAN